MPMINSIFAEIFSEMAVTRLERKARRNKTKAKARTAAIKRNIRRNYVASPNKEESGIILEEDITTIAENLNAPAAKKAKKATKAAEPVAEVVETPAAEEAPATDDNASAEA